MLPCTPDFLRQLAIDFGVTEANREKVGKKLAQTYAFYQTQVTGESLTQIVDTAQRNAVREFASLEEAVEGALKYFIISAVIAVLVLSLFGFYMFGYVTDSALFFMTFLVVLVATCAFLYYSFYRRVQAEVATFTKAVDALYTELVAQVQKYITTQEAALESANGLLRFFIDLGVAPFTAASVLQYLNNVRNTYEENRPDPSDLIAKIEAKEFLDSVENDAERIVFAMGVISLTLIIASIAFCISFLVSIFVLREPMYSITALTVYLIFILFLYYFARYLFTGAGRGLVVPSIEEEIQAYFSAQEKALNAALCTSP